MLPEKGTRGGGKLKLSSGFTLAKLLLECIVILEPKARGLGVLGGLRLVSAIPAVICFYRGGPTAPHALTAPAIKAVRATSHELPMSWQGSSFVLGECARQLWMPQKGF